MLATLNLLDATLLVCRMQILWNAFRNPECHAQIHTFAFSGKSYCSQEHDIKNPSYTILLNACVIIGFIRFMIHVANVDITRIKFIL